MILNRIARNVRRQDWFAVGIEMLVVMGGLEPPTYGL